jgi:hypothetical protein
MLMEPCSCVEEIKIVATSTPADSNCEVETKPEPCTTSEKLLPDTCVTRPEARTGRGLRTLTLIDVEDAGSYAVVAVIVTE